MPFCIGRSAHVEPTKRSLRSRRMENNIAENVIAPELVAARGFARRATANGKVRLRHLLMAWAMLLGFAAAFVFMILAYA